jgi:hypothetical protein
MGKMKQFDKGMTFNGDENYKWLRPDLATRYFSMGRSALDKLAIECDAKKKVGNRITLYDVEKLDRYIKTL